MGPLIGPLGLHTPSPDRHLAQSTAVLVLACAVALPRCPSTERRDHVAWAHPPCSQRVLFASHSARVRSEREHRCVGDPHPRPCSFAIAPCTPAASHFMLVCPCPVCTAPLRADNTAPACAVAARLTWRPCLSWRPQAWFPSRAVWGAPRPAAVQRARRARQRARPHGAGPPLQSIPRPP